MLPTTVPAMAPPEMEEDGEGVEGEDRFVFVAAEDESNVTALENEDGSGSPGARASVVAPARDDWKAS